MIQKAALCDARILAEMAVQMWDSHTPEELAAEFSGLISEARTAFFIKYQDHLPVGFAQCGMRHDYVEGTETSPVGYLEGVFVKPQWRRKGFAAELVNACQQWAKDNGSREFASDCELSNITSQQFHLAMGFQEANRIICFTKKL